MAAGKIPRFDCPWPIDDADGDVPQEQKKMAGLSGFVHMLRMFNRFRALRPVESEKTKGVLIVADARDDRDETFNNIKQQIIEATKFGVPDEIRQVAQSPDKHPSIAILLIPLQGSGSLETLCLEQLLARHPKVSECLDGYMNCEGVASSMTDWTTQKKEKARLQSLIAVTNKEDPNKTLRRLFSTNKIKEARINVSDDCFKPVCDAVAAFCSEVSAQVTPPE